MRFYVRRRRLRGLASSAPRRPWMRRALTSSRATRSGPGSRQPDFAIRERRLRRAATHAGAQAEAYAARANSVLAVKKCQLFNEVTDNLGTQRHPHQTRRNLSPPRANLVARPRLFNSVAPRVLG